MLWLLFTHAWQGSVKAQYHNPIIAIDFNFILRTRVEYYLIMISLFYDVETILFIAIEKGKKRKPHEWTIYYLFMSNVFVVCDNIFTGIVSDKYFDHIKY